MLIALFISSHFKRHNHLYTHNMKQALSSTERARTYLGLSNRKVKNLKSGEKSSFVASIYAASFNVRHAFECANNNSWESIDCNEICLTFHFARIVRMPTMNKRENILNDKLMRRPFNASPKHPNQIVCKCFQWNSLWNSNIVLACYLVIYKVL